MKVSAIGGLLAAAGMLGAATGATAGSSCTATCNSANAQCLQSGKNDTVCLAAWHQCKVGCATSAAPAKMQVTRPSPNTVVIKTTPAAATHH